MKLLNKLTAKSYKLTATKGFSLVELLVVLAIFVIITSVVLARQNRFSSDILLTDTAYQIAISIRQAQVYGLGVRCISSPCSSTNSNTNQYKAGYGVHLAGPVPKTSYVFFPDLDQSGDCTETNDSLCTTELSAAGASTYQISKAKISDVCVPDVRGGTRCLSGGNGLSWFDVVYVRPDPSAKINSNLSTNPNGTYSKLSITVTSTLGDRNKCVVIYSTGEVSVSNPATPSSPCQ